MGGKVFLRRRNFEFFAGYRPGNERAFPLSARVARRFPHWGKHTRETCTNMAPLPGELSAELTEGGRRVFKGKALERESITASPEMSPGTRIVYAFCRGHASLRRSAMYASTSLRSIFSATDSSPWRISFARFMVASARLDLVLRSDMRQRSPFIIATSASLL